MPIGFKGHVRHPNKDYMILNSRARHALMRMAIPVATESKYDSRDQGIIGPIKDQGQCGSCWDFSGTGVVEVAFYKAGVLKADGSQVLSEEYTLSCGKNGGCGGDDNVTVLAEAKATGIPLASDYGPYTASRGRCSWKSSQKLYKVDDWGFCTGDGQGGEAATQDIKNCIKYYGCVGSGVAAGGTSFWNSGAGTDTGRSNNIDHDVIIIGWDDDHDNGDGSKGAWLMRNSWNTSWGSMQGYAWVKYGADGLGTEACWAFVNPITPQVIDWQNM